MRDRTDTSAGVSSRKTLATGPATSSWPAELPQHADAREASPPAADAHPATATQPPAPAAHAIQHIFGTR